MKPTDKPLNADDVAKRFCSLMGSVQEALGWSKAADCFCGRGGFWGTPRYGGTYDEGYRNEGEALEFIERAVRDALTSPAAVTTGGLRTLLLDAKHAISEAIWSEDGLDGMEGEDLCRRIDAALATPLPESHR